MTAKVEIVIKVQDQGASTNTNKVTDAVEGLGTAAVKADRQVSAFGQIAIGAMRKVGEMATDALASAGQALVDFVGTSLQGAGDYEQSMNLFAATTEASGDQMQEVKKIAKELGADLTLPATSAASAGAAMTELAKAGLSVDDAMGAAKGTLQLAAAGSLDEAKAAEIAANALNTFGLAGTEASSVADLLAASANASSIEVTDAADSLKMAGSVFSSFQGPTVGAKDALVDLTTAVSLLGNAGIKGSDAGTSLKQSLLQLAAPSKTAKGLMEQLAQRIGESGDIAYDASGKMRPYREIIDLTARATANMTDEERQYTIATIFGADASRAMITLMRQGTEGWDKMREAVTRQNAASELAGARMQGLNGATQGLTSQIETLSLEALEPLLPILTANIQQLAAFAGSFAGKVGPAVEGAITTISAAAGVIQELFIPAVGGAAAALIAYGMTAIPALLPQIGALVTSVAASSAAFAAQATAIAATAAPLAAVATVVGIAVARFNDYNNSIEAATQKTLDAQSWWIRSSEAVKSYALNTGEASEKLKPYIDTVNQLRSQIQGEVADLGRRMTAGMVSDAQYAAEMATIKQHSAELDNATAAYTELEIALNEQVAAASTGTAALQKLQTGEQQIQQETSITTEEMKKLAKQIEDTFQKGSEAVSAYVDTEISFMDTLDEVRRTGNTEKLQEQAIAYAQEQAAQKAHLGQMLSEYTVAQVQMGNISNERAQTITAVIEREFGVQADVSGRTFLEMTAAIDHWAASGSGDASRLGAALDTTADRAVLTRTEMEGLSKKYTAELVQNFKEGKIDADNLADALKRIPERVYSTLNINGTGVIGARAIGGPVEQGSPYLVGERGPELFVPGQSGSIVPNDQIMNTGAQITIIYNRAPNERDDVLSDVRAARMLYG